MRSLIGLIMACLVQIAWTSHAELRTDFRVRGKLYLTCPGRPRILSAGKHLLLEAPDGKQEVISSLAQLRGEVSVRTPEQALNFVRLLGAPILSGALGDGRIFEISTKDQASALSFGDRESVLALSNARDGAYGVVSKATMKRIGLSAAAAGPAGAKFRIVRYLLDFSFADRQYHILKVEEFVDQNGEYEQNVLTNKVVTSGMWVQGFIG